MENRRLVRAFIVDDDANSTQLLCRLLEDYSVEIIGKATDAGQPALNAIVDAEPDLLFLDVEMPSMTGLDFWGMLQSMVRSDMKVVFYTGYDKYMLEALRRQAFDYMLKPASRQELAKIMTRYYENRLSRLQETVANGTIEQPSVMVVNAVNDHTVLRSDDIAFFRFDSERRIWEVVTTTGQSHQLRHRTTADAILAYSRNFVQIHKAYIVNAHQIASVRNNSCQLRPPLDGVTELHISKNYRPGFMATFYNL